MNLPLFDRQNEIESLQAAGSIAFMGERLICDASGVLFWPSKNCLVVSDLHLEKGRAMAQRGQLLPPQDTRQTLGLLAHSIAKWNPDIVISLGDSFHNEKVANELGDDTKQMLCALMEHRRWIWITGNHDEQLPDNFAGEVFEELVIGPIRFHHEPDIRAIAHDCDTGEICGHLHPKARVIQRGKRIVRKCFACDERRIIMPAFGAYTGGLELGHAAFDGLLEREQMFAMMLGRERVYRIKSQNLCLPR